MAELIQVTIVNEDGRSIRAQPVVLRPDPPMTCEDVITEIRAGGYGEGFLLQDCITVKRAEPVKAGNYTYCVTASQPQAPQPHAPQQPQAPAGVMTLREFLGQVLPLVKCVIRSPSSTGTYPEPGLEVKEWTGVEQAILSFANEPSMQRAYSGLETFRPTKNKCISETSLKVEYFHYICGALNEVRALRGEPHRWNIEMRRAANTKATQQSAQQPPPPTPLTAILDLKKQPDYELVDVNFRPRCFIELKPEDVLLKLVKDFESLASAWDRLKDEQRNGNRTTLKNVLGQLVEYAFALRIRYFAVELYSWMWVCHIRNGKLFISRAFKNDKQDLAKLLILEWLTQQSMGPDGLLEPHELRLGSRPITGQPGTAPPSPTDGSAPHSHSDSSPMAPGGDGFNGHVESDQSSSTASAEALILDVRDVLGRGHTGPVYAGWFNGRPVAVKASTDPELEQELMVEASNYHHIASQQVLSQKELALPTLVYAGRTPGGNGYMLLTSLEEGRSMCKDDHALLQPALAALRGVHSMGFCHGDVRLDNFRVITTGGCQHVKILDLGHAYRTSDEEDFRAEEMQLRALLAAPQSTLPTESVNDILIMGTGHVSTPGGVAAEVQPGYRASRVATQAVRSQGCYTGVRYHPLLPSRTSRPLQKKTPAASASLSRRLLLS